MASRIGGRNNCPTSDRDGRCITRIINSETISAIAEMDGKPFMPSAEDRRAMKRRDQESKFAANDTLHLRLELSETTNEEEERAALKAEIRDRESSLDTLAGPSVSDLRLLESETQN